MRHTILKIKMKQKILFTLVIILGLVQTNVAQITKLLDVKCFEGENYRSDGYSSDYHQKHVGEIIFSNQTIQKDDQSNLITEYNLGDNLHLRYFFPEEGIANTVFSMIEKDAGLKNISNLSFAKRKIYQSTGDCLDGERLIKNLGFKVKFSVDGKEFITTEIKRYDLDTENKQSYTTLRSGLDNATENFGQELLKEFMDKMSRQSKGSYDVKIELIPFIENPLEFEGDVMASGTLKMNVGDFDVSDKNLCPLPTNKWEKDNREEFEADIMEAFKKQNWEEVPQSVIIVSDDWRISRHEYTGVILYRYVSAYVVSTRGDECIFQDFVFKQDYNGSGFQDRVYLQGIGKQHNIACQCLD